MVLGAYNLLMDKKEARKLGAWVSLLAGLCFVAGGAAAVSIMFFMKPGTGIRILIALGRLLHPSSS